jgi:hypothetical protein
MIALLLTRQVNAAIDDAGTMFDLFIILGKTRLDSSLQLHQETENLCPSRHLFPFRGTIQQVLFFPAGLRERLQIQTIFYLFANLIDFFGLRKVLLQPVLRSLHLVVCFISLVSLVT